MYNLHFYRNKNISAIYQAFVMHGNRHSFLKNFNDFHPIFCANSIHIIPWRRLSHVNLDNISVNNGSPKYQKTNYAPPTKWVEYHFAEFRSMCRRLRDVLVVRDDRKIEYIIYFLVDRHLRKAYVMRYLIFFFVNFVYLKKSFNEIQNWYEMVKTN